MSETFNYKDPKTPLRNLNPVAGGKALSKDIKKMKAKTPAIPPAVPPVSMRGQDIIDTSRDAMIRERKRKGIGSTILASSYRPGGSAPATFGARTILGSS